MCPALCAGPHCPGSPRREPRRPLTVTLAGLTLPEPLADACSPQAALLQSDYERDAPKKHLAACRAADTHAEQQPLPSSLTCPARRSPSGGNGRPPETSQRHRLRIRLCLQRPPRARPQSRCCAPRTPALGRNPRPKAAPRPGQEPGPARVCSGPWPQACRAETSLHGRVPRGQGSEDSPLAYWVRPGRRPWPSRPPPAGSVVP